MDIVTTPPTPRTVNPPVNDNHVMASHLAKQNSLQNLRWVLYICSHLAKQNSLQNLRWVLCICSHLAKQNSLQNLRWVLTFVHL